MRTNLLFKSNSSPYLLAEAAFSDDRTRRYWLRRVWAGNDPQRVLWVILNPSKADALADDPTVRKCVGFSKRWGFGGMDIINLFSARATNPRELYGHVAFKKIRMDDEDLATWRAFLPAAPLVVFAWGVHGELAARDRRFQDEAAGAAALAKVTTLGFTKWGHPRHPLHLTYATPRRPWLLSRL